LKELQQAMSPGSNIPIFHYSYPSSKMFARSPTDSIPRARQAIGTKQTMITIFFPGRKLLVLDILPKSSKLSQLSFVDYMLPDLKRENMDFPRRIRQAPFWVHLDNSTCHSGSKLASKFEKHHVS
jgi:hypothetical protein